MAYEAKTKPTDQSVIEFIEEIDSKAKKEDAYRLLDIYADVTGMEPVMWGTSIIGYGTYHYEYATGHSGETSIAGFSPRKAAHSLYLTMNEERKNELLAKLGKHRRGKSCVYVNKLADIDVDILKQMIEESVTYIKSNYPTSDLKRPPS